MTGRVGLSWSIDQLNKSSDLSLCDSKAEGWLTGG